jgi:hippurate hydrolase
MKTNLFLVMVAIMVSSNVFAQDFNKNKLSNSIADEVKMLVEKDKDRLIDIYKDIHQNPELGFMEIKTAEIVAEELKSLGFEVKTGIGKTGVVGILKNGDGPVLMYRADMDAIAAEEKTGLEYASTKKVTNKDGIEVPVAHLCGHDAHTTWLLGMAKVMVNLKDKWKGTLIMVGQPSEESIEGATAMVNDGLYTTFKVPEPDYLIGMHTAPIPTGTALCKGGTLMAGTEQLDVTFYGQSAHGSSPQFSKDAGLMAAYAVIQYQAIISRVLDPRDPAVITVGAINAGNENNTIPGIAELKLNFRFFKEEVREQLYKGVKNVSEGIAKTYGMPDDKLPAIVRKGYSGPLTNDENLMERIASNLSGTGVILQENIITDVTPTTGSEDCHMLVHGIEKTKLAYLALGIAPPQVFEKAKKEGKALPYSNHQADFMVDLNAIPHGALVASVIALDLLIK